MPPRPEAPLYEFHSGFWLNTHLRLHYAATGRRPAPASAPPAPDAPAWNAAVGYYTERFGSSGGFSVLFDDVLVSTGRRLSEAESSPSLPSGIDPAIAKQLEAAGTVMRADWPAQDRMNRDWVASLEPALANHGKALQAALAHAYQARWPSSPIRVDVSCFAGPVGAYTVLDPVHITISSCNDSMQGDAALETIFHEASHALIDPIEKKIEAAAKAAGRPVSKDLWHAVLFYSTGEIVRQRLGNGYIPYAIKNGLWSRGSFDGLEPLLRKEWQPYLDKKRELDAAIEALVAAAPAAPPDKQR